MIITPVVVVVIAVTTPAVVVPAPAVILAAASFVFPTVVIVSVTSPLLKAPGTSVLLAPFAFVTPIRDGRLLAVVSTFVPIDTWWQTRFWMRLNTERQGLALRTQDYIRGCGRTALLFDFGGWLALVAQIDLRGGGRITLVFNSGGGRPSSVIEHDGGIITVITNRGSISIVQTDQKAANDETNSEQYT